jgi:hypothetical protein
MMQERSTARLGQGLFRLVVAAVAGALLALSLAFSALYFRIVPLPQPPAPQPTVPSPTPLPQASPVPQASSPPQSPTIVNFRVCLGEYERNCPPHDVYMYCYQDVGAWASQRCDIAKVIPLGSQSGNKCGYTSVQVICTGPK